MCEKMLLCFFVLIALPYIIAALWSAHIDRVYRGYLGIESRLNTNANELVERAAREAGFVLEVVSLERQTRPKLTDYYDSGTVYLSHYNYLSNNVVALSVAAHEFGHAFQDFTADTGFVVRTSLLAQPTLGFAIGLIVILIGWMNDLTWVTAMGAVIWGIALVVDINTLKNEHDASRIARELLETRGMPQEELALCDHILRICGQSYLVGIFRHMVAAIVVIIVVACLACETKKK